MEVRADQVYINGFSKDLKDSLSEKYIKGVYANGVGSSRKVFSLEEDWVTGAIAGSYGWTVSATGGASTMNTAQLSQTNWGIAQISSGTTSGNFSTLSTSNPRIILGTATMYWESNIQLTALANAGTNTYTARFGIYDNITGAPNNGVYLEYDVTTSANWRYGNANGGSRTVTSSSTAVAAGSFLKLGIRTTGNSAEYFVNDSSIGTQTTDFPTNAIIPAFSILKGAVGATAGVMLIDWVNIYANWSTAR